MSRVPLNLKKVQVGVTTNVAPNTPQATTVLAAPGAGQRIRMRKVVFSYFRAATGAASVVAGGISGAHGIALIDNSAGGNKGAELEWPGGFAMPTNTLIAFYNEATIASVSLIVTLYYTVEPA